MTCIRIPNGVVCLSDATEHVIIVNGKAVRFEFDKRFGPSVLTRHGKIARQQPGERSAFWPAFARWYAEHGGPPVEEPPEVVHIGGSTWVTRGPGGRLPIVGGVEVKPCPGCKRCGSKSGGRR